MKRTITPEQQTKMQMARVRRAAQRPGYVAILEPWPSARWCSWVVGNIAVNQIPEELLRAAGWERVNPGPPAHEHMYSADPGNPCLICQANPM